VLLADLLLAPPLARLPRSLFSPLDLIAVVIDWHDNFFVLLAFITLKKMNTKKLKNPCNDP
jgi:hypothetical protein